MHETPLAIVVEGHGERYSLESMIKQIVRGPFGEIPTSSPVGFGGICRDLRGRLKDIILLRRPRTVLVVVDAADPVRLGQFSDCIALKQHLEAQAHSALQDLRHAGFTATPRRVAVVLPVPTFDRWLAAGCAKEHITDDADIDDAEVLRQSLGSRFRKKMNQYQTLVRAADMRAARSCSRSWRKFVKEAAEAYLEWASERGQQAQIQVL